MKDIIYTRKYTDKTGVERKEYINVGMLFEKEGRMSIKLKGFINLAALQNEKGEVWLNVYEHTKKTEETQKMAKTEYKTEPTVDEIPQVVNDGKAYAEKWAEMAEKDNASADLPF
jgi:hypothetical protein